MGFYELGGMFMGRWELLEVGAVGGGIGGSVIECV